MKINKKILSIPPYISTSWDNISLIQYTEGILVISTIDGSEIEVPYLEDQTINHIFAVHADFLESSDHSSIEPLEKASKMGNPFEQLSSLLSSGNEAMGFPISFGPEGLGGAMAHNPEQSDLADLPKEILEKISAVTKALISETPLDIPKAEPHCNCTHCQIARSMQGSNTEEYDEDEELKNILNEEVSDKDLSFREWDIQESQEGNQIFLVSNPIDKTENYSVCLKANSIGCTCGKANCNHIKAVLKS